MSDSKSKNIFVNIFRKKSSSKSRSGDKHEVVGPSRPLTSDDFEAPGFMMTNPKARGSHASPPPVSNWAHDPDLRPRQTPRMRVRDATRETFEVPKDIPIHASKDLSDDDEDPEEQPDDAAQQQVPLADDGDDDDADGDDDDGDDYLPVMLDESIPMDTAVEEPAHGTHQRSRRASPCPPQREVHGHEDKSSRAPNLGRGTRNWMAEIREYNRRNQRQAKKEAQLRRLANHQPPQAYLPPPQLIQHTYYQPPPVQPHLPPPSLYQPFPQGYQQQMVPPQTSYYVSPYGHSPVHRAFTSGSPPGSYYALQLPTTFSTYARPAPAHPQHAPQHTYYSEPHRHSVGADTNQEYERAFDQDMTQRMRREYMWMLAETEKLQWENDRLREEIAKDRERRHQHRDH